jgi:hypothetical protein
MPKAEQSEKVGLCPPVPRVYRWRRRVALVDDPRTIGAMKPAVGAESDDRRKPLWKEGFLPALRQVFGRVDRLLPEVSQCRTDRAYGGKRSVGIAEL